MGIFPRFCCSRGNIFPCVASCMNNHNQAKSWEYFHDFVAVMGIYFLVSCRACTTTTRQNHGNISAISLQLWEYISLCRVIVHDHKQAKLWEYFRDFVACCGNICESCRHTQPGKNRLPFRFAAIAGSGSGFGCIHCGSDFIFSSKSDRKNDKMTC